MTFQRYSKAVVVCATVMALSACASIPHDFEQVPSTSWPKPEQTRLGKFFGAYAPADSWLSGVRLLANPKVAFRARFGGAFLAEKSLDLQYYLWKGDLTGKLLLVRALEAADRGVHVRILIDDIYHSGRDNNYAAIDSHPNMEVRVYNPMGSRGAGKGAKFFSGREPVEVVHIEEHPDRSSALKREAAIKSLNREQKVELVRVGDKPPRRPC